jgi:O-antigen/teichoic acid export membrane protein
MPLPLQRTLRADLFSRGERGNLVRSAGATASINVGYILIGLGASLLYARLLGPHDYGLYAYVMACAQILIVPTGLGLPSYLVREGAKAPQSLVWLKRWADRNILVIGVAAAALLACGYFLPQAAGARVLFLIAAPMPLLTNLSSVRKALVQALGRVARSQWPQSLLAPGVTLLVVVGLWLVRGGFTVQELMLVTVAATVLPVLANGWQLRVATHGHAAAEPAQVRIKAALPFMWLSAMYLINARVDVIMLGSLRGAHDAGIYAVAVRAAELVPYLMVVANLTIAPKVSRLHQEGTHGQLQRLISATAVRVFLATLPLALVLIVGAHFLLELFYGADFAEGAIVIRTLAISQLFVVALGPVGVLLNMTKHADLSAKAFTAGAGLNVVLNAILIPLLGIAGAAIATGISTATSYLLCWYMVRRQLALRPSFLGV